MKKYRPTILMGILVLAILLFIVLNNTSNEEEISEILPNVKIMEISTSYNQEQSEFVGIIQPKETYQGTFSTYETITNVFVESGQHVKKGTVLMSVSDKEAQENLINAQQAYNSALIDQEQAELLMNDEAMNVQSEVNNNQDRIAQYRFEAAVSNYKASTIQTFIALNNVKLAQQQVVQTNLISQIDGYVSMILQEEGDLATPHMPSVVIASHEKVAVITLSQSNVNRISEKSVAQIITENEEFDGLVSAVSNIFDKTSRTYEAKVDVGLKEELTIGKEVKVIVELEETLGTWIDLSILKNDGQDYVYVISVNRINKRMVERLDLVNNLVLVTNLTKGDVLVVEGFSNLRVGDKVNVVGEYDD